MPTIKKEAFGCAGNGQGGVSGSEEISNDVRYFMERGTFDASSVVLLLRTIPSA